MVSSVDRKKARSRTSTRRTGANRKVNSAMAKANLALKLARSLQRDVEFKTHTFTIVSEAANAASTLNMTAIPAGDNSVSRIGNDCMLKDFEMRGKFSWNLNDTTSKVQVMRLIMFVDKQQVSDTIPNALALMGSTLVDTVSLPSRVNVPSRFTIIKDKTWIMHNPFQTSAGNQGNGQGVVYHTFHWKFPFKKRLRFNGDNAGDINKNGVYIQLSSETATGPSLEAEGRFNFTG